MDHVILSTANTPILRLLEYAQAPGRPPLTPATAAMMLLPRQAGQAYVPSALRHLMDPGSPIADFYHVCPQCMALGDRIADAMSLVRSLGAGMVL